MASNILAQAAVLCFLFISTLNSLDIDVRPRSVRPGDQNVTFTCAGRNDTDTALERMIAMRLLRLNDEGQWTDIVVLKFDGSIDMQVAGATALGRLGEAYNSDLKVTWPSAPDDVNGIYRCEAIALSSTGDVVKEKSRELHVTNLPNGLPLLLDRLKKSEQRLIGNVNETMYRSMKSSKTNLLSALNSKFDDMKEYFGNKTALRLMEKEKDESPMHWPAEQFTLLMPSNGCPSKPSSWIKGFKKMKAFKEDKYYPISESLHLANPHKKNGFIYRQFCTLPKSPERTVPWPAGSYCIYSMITSTCPPGFTYTKAKAKILSDEANYYHYYSGKDPSKSTSGVFSTSSSWFCCRHDGNASIPINLPVTDPFYLFRHRGRCQEVNGMDIIQDVFMMETVEDADSNKWFDTNEQYRPDVSFQPYIEYLCYYSKRKD